MWPVPGCAPAHGGSLARGQFIPAEKVAWPFEFVFPFEMWVYFAKYSEES